MCHDRTRSWVGPAYLLLCGVFISNAAADVASDYQRFDEALNVALEERDADFTGRLQLADDVQEALGPALDPLDQLILKARYVGALANMRLGNFDDSFATLGALCPTIPGKQQAVLQFRCDILYAYLLLVRGQQTASLAAYREVFSNTSDDVPEALITRARIGYAVVLNENGRSGEAVDMYEQALISAIRNQNDLISLYAGNNLIVILIDLKDYRAARQTLEQLGPARERNPQSLVSGSLLLHEMELARLGGDPTQAAAGLRRFIDDGIDTTPLMLGSAHQLLAESLRDLGRLDEATMHGRQAVDLLVDQAHEVTDARLSLAETLIEMGRLSEATELLASIDPSAEPVPTTLADYGRLTLLARLQTLGDVAALDAFEQFVTAHEQQDAIASTTRTEYFDARMKVSEQAFALQKAGESARFALLQRERENRSNRLLLAFVIVVSILGVLLIGLQLRRTTEKRLLAEKVRLNQQMEQNKRFEAIGMLAGNVAHDVNNLLQVVASSNETLRSDFADRKESSLGAIELSEQALDYGTKIVRQLLTFSKSKELKAKPISFSAYLKETQTLLASALGEERSLSVVDDSEKLSIIADPTQLTTSILNLIRNCVDAMPEGGEVVLSAAPISITGAKGEWAAEIEPGRYLQLRIADSGTGMTESVLERSIEPFFTTKDKQSGSGLGLSSVYAFARQSGGDLRIQSELGAGTAVELIFPISDVQVPEVATVPSANESLAGELTVLMVEDNEMLAVALRKNLAALDANVFHLVSADLAKDWLLTGSTPVDILLTDIRMPGKINGLDLARWARSQFPQLKIVLMSGYIDQDSMPYEFTVIRKPFRLSELAMAIRDESIESNAAANQ
ncbi:MAG: ATP-binding protein [Pseudomonadota bacterium]